MGMDDCGYLFGCSFGLGLMLERMVNMQKREDRCPLCQGTGKIFYKGYPGGCYMCYGTGKFAWQDGATRGTLPPEEGEEEIEEDGQ